VLKNPYQSTAHGKAYPQPFEQILGLGITNQRETNLIWDRKIGQPLYPAIVWQDRRTSAHCSNTRARSTLSGMGVGGESDQITLAKPGAIII
jgi:glycerol kinase